MESIKNSFKHDYNLAVDCFNKKDYTSFFRNVRPAIELLCKLVIYDIINNDATSTDIVEGRKSIQKSKDNLFTLIQDLPQESQQVVSLLQYSSCLLYVSSRCV